MFQLTILAGESRALVQFESKRNMHFHHLHLRNFMRNLMYGVAENDLIAIQTEHHYIPESKMK